MPNSIVSATNVWEVRFADGNDTNGGGFNPSSSGTDYSQQASPQLTVTDGVTTSGNSTITSATGGFTSGMVGSTVAVVNGSTVVGRYEISTYNSTNSVTLLGNTGLTTATGLTFKVGGALNTLGETGGYKLQSNLVYFKGTTSTLTTSTYNVSGGPVQDSTGGVSGGRVGGWIGYSTNRTYYNTDTRPTISAGSVTGLSNGMFRFNGSYLPSHLNNVILDCNNGASNAGVIVNVDAASYVTRVLAKNAKGYGLYSKGRVHFSECAATGCSTNPAIFCEYSSFTTYDGCLAYANTVSGFAGDFSAGYQACISALNTGSTSDGWQRLVVTSGPEYIMTNCVAYKNGRDGLRTSNSSMQVVKRSIFYGNGASGTGYGVNSTNSNNSGLRLIDCFTGANATGAVTGVLSDTQINLQSLSGNPFTDGDNYNFSLNNTSGAGALVRAILTRLAPEIAATSYIDGGAVQHQDSGGGGGALVFDFGFNGGFGS